MEVFGGVRRSPFRRPENPDHTGGLSMLILSLIAAITTSIIMRFNELEPARVALEESDRSWQHRR